MSSYQVELLVDANDILSESPIWHPTEKKLYWIGLFGPSVHCFDPITKQLDSWTLPKRYQTIGAIAPRRQGGLIASIGQGIAFIDLSSGDVTQFTKTGDLRMNDAKCDRFGRFYAGSASSSIESREAVFYRINPDFSVKALDEKLGLSNGISFSPDNQYLYLNDSWTQTMYRYDYDADSGDISHREIFYTFKKGYPDGLTVDSEGFIWIAVFGEACVLRLSPEGKQADKIDLPVTRPTSVGFGGEDYKTLFITTANYLPPEESPAERPAGGIFSIQVDVPGLQEGVFAG